MEQRQDLLWARFGGSTSSLPTSQWSEHNHTGTYSCKRLRTISYHFTQKKEDDLGKIFSWSMPHLSIFWNSTKSLLIIQLLQAVGECLPNFYRTCFFHPFFYISHQIFLYIATKAYVFDCPSGSMITCKTIVILFNVFVFLTL